VGYLLNMTGHHRVSARVYGVAALVNVAANVAGIWLFGLPGAALATMLSVVLWNVWLHRLVSRILDLHPSIVSVLFSPTRSD
jgi:O-antigen/teichoic acid export membrane protein